MKTLKIYERTITERSRYGGYFNTVKQVTIMYDGELYENHYEDINNRKLKVKFACVLDTRSTRVLEQYMSALSKRSDYGKFVRKTLAEILKK